MLKFIKNCFTKNGSPQRVGKSADKVEQINLQQNCSLNPVQCGNLDAKHGGWFNDASGELFEGFPISSEDIVIDVGCGNGSKTHFCAMQGAHVIFVDINANKVATTQHRLADTPARKAEPIVCDSNPLPLEDASVTKVVSTEVIEHVEDPAQFINELVRIGRPGAQYLITAPHPASENLQQKFAAPSYFEPPNHIRILQQEEFKQLLTDAGLIIERYTCRGFYWTMWWTFFWQCENQGFTEPWHPLLENWGKTWETLLNTPSGPEVKKALDEIMPKNQIIIARKPA